MQDLIIAGASGFGRELLAVIKEINNIHPSWNVLGFIDDNLNALDDFDCGQKVLGKIAGWQKIGNELYAIAIAKPAIKRKVVEELRAINASFTSIIHPSCKIGERAMVGEGLVMFSMAKIGVDVKVGDFVFLDSYVTVGHDAVIGSYTTLAPKCSLGGKTVLGESVNVGTAASTYPGVKVGDFATIGMNSAVIRKVKSGTTVMGVPAVQIS